MMQLLWQSLSQSFTPSTNQTVDQRQRSTSGFGTLRNAALIALAVGALSKPAQAFDTGHHFDLTREAMQDQGFGNTAIEVAQLENWLTDYYSSSPTSSIIPTSSIKSEVAKLHFDNLLNTQQARNYWGHFTINTRNAVLHLCTKRQAGLMRLLPPHKMFLLAFMILHFRGLLHRVIQNTEATMMV